MDPPGHTVLVVDDDQSIRFLCRVNLELDGYRVLEAAAIAQAREQVEGSDVTVVLLDVHVGSERSLDFLGELRASHPDVRVALLTGSADAPAGTGADAVIAKPFTLDELLQTVRELAG